MSERPPKLRFSEPHLWDETDSVRVREVLERLSRLRERSAFHVLDARRVIEENKLQAQDVIQGRIRDIASEDYWSGYFDASRHALNALQFPDSEETE